MATFDFKKEYKELYLPGKKPSLIEVPEMSFIMVNGKGNPNTSETYKHAIELLYGLSYSIKMSKKSGSQPENYFDYVVPPLEGLWWGEDEKIDGLNIVDKEKFNWISMIRQPDFVTEEVFLWAKEQLAKKKPDLDLSKAYFKIWNEGLCAQIMHTGSYDEEHKTIEILGNFVTEQGYENDISNVRPHHEIYLGDPRRTAPDKLRTIIRHPIKEKDV